MSKNDTVIENNRKEDNNKKANNTASAVAAALAFKESFSSLEQRAKEEAAKQQADAYLYQKKQEAAQITPKITPAYQPVAQKKEEGKKAVNSSTLAWLDYLLPEWLQPQVAKIYQQVFGQPLTFSQFHGNNSNDESNVQQNQAPASANVTGVNPPTTVAGTSTTSTVTPTTSTTDTRTAPTPTRTINTPSTVGRTTDNKHTNKTGKSSQPSRNQRRPDLSSYNLPPLTKAFLSNASNEDIGWGLLGKTLDFQVLVQKNSDLRIFFGSHPGKLDLVMLGGLKQISLQVNNENRITNVQITQIRFLAPTDDNSPSHGL